MPGRFLYPIRDYRNKSKKSSERLKGTIGTTQRRHCFAVGMCVTEIPSLNDGTEDTSKYIPQCLQTTAKHLGFQFGTRDGMV